MIETQRLLSAIDRKVRMWDIKETFNTALEAKRCAAKLFIEASGVLVAPYAGGTYTVFAWTKEQI